MQTHIVRGEDCFWFLLRLECSRALKSCRFHGKLVCFLKDLWGKRSNSLVTKMKYENILVSAMKLLNKT